jgi:hypothetical protein
MDVLQNRKISTLKTWMNKNNRNRLTWLSENGVNLPFSLLPSQELSVILILTGYTIVLSIWFWVF